MNLIIDIYNLSKPWDCERFSNTKTICYCGGGGGGGDPVKKIIKETKKVAAPVTKVVEDTGKTIEKNVSAATNTATGALTTLGKGVTHGVNQVMKPVAAGLTHATGEVLKGFDHNLKQVAFGADMLGGALLGRKKPSDDGPGTGQGPGSSASRPGMEKDTVGAGSLKGLQGDADMKSTTSSSRQGKSKLKIKKKTVKV